MKKYVLLLLSVLAFVSCDEGDSLETDKTAEGPKIVGFKSATANVAYFEDLGVKDHSFPVSLIGLGNGQLSTSDIAIDYEVDLVNSTATEGVEFDFADAAGKITIPAGSDYGTLNLKVNTGQLNATAKTELVLNLKPAAGIAIGEKQKTLKIVFVGCATNLVGNYNTYLVAGATSTFAGAATIVKIAPNVYRCSRLPGISSGGQPVTFDFSDVCKDLEISAWQFEGSYPMFKTGTTGERPTGVIESPSGNLFFTGVNLTGLAFYTDKNFRLVKI